MRVSRVQAEENRRTVIEVAGRLFREHGFDGIGLKDLMAAAGLTQGGFYKQFKSKDDLSVQACERVLADSIESMTHVAESADDPLAAIVTRYLSPDHRGQIDSGCIFPSLGSDAARHTPALIHSFETGIKSYLALLERSMRASPAHGTTDEPAVVFSTMVGALLLSRLVEDHALADRILDAAAGHLLYREGKPEAEEADKAFS